MINKKAKSPWYQKYLSTYNISPDKVPASVTDIIAKQLKQQQCENPVVTVSVIAYNEDKNLWACLWALSDMQCSYPLEIIGVNNNSSDLTEEIFIKSGIPYFNELRNSCGFARECGLLNARGKYHINIDADTLYPPNYVSIMVDALSQKGVVAASSSWGYIADKDHSRLSLWCYEGIRDIFLFFQSINKPELSVRGLVFAYHTALAKKVGIRTDIKRGEDGSLALALKKFGKIVFVRNKNAKAITGYGTLSADGSLFNSFKVRVLKGIKNLPSMFSRNNRYEDDETNIINNNK